MVTKTSKTAKKPKKKSTSISMESAVEKGVEKGIENTVKKMIKKAKSCKTEKGCSCNQQNGCLYFLGFVGALVYYISTATSFWNGVLGVLKAIVWPAMLVFKLFGL